MGAFLVPLLWFCTSAFHRTECRCTSKCTSKTHQSTEHPCDLWDGGRERRVSPCLLSIQAQAFHLGTWKVGIGSWETIYRRGPAILLQRIVEWMHLLGIHEISLKQSMKIFPVSTHDNHSSTKTGSKISHSPLSSNSPPPEWPSLLLLQGCWAVDRRTYTAQLSNMVS